jgi:hypothetical protein
MFRVSDFSRGGKATFFSLCKKQQKRARAKSHRQTAHNQTPSARIIQNTPPSRYTHTHTHRFAFQRALLIVRKQLLRARKLEVSNCTGNNKFQLLKKQTNMSRASLRVANNNTPIAVVDAMVNDEDQMTCVFFAVLIYAETMCKHINCILLFFLLFFPRAFISFGTPFRNACE